jgi:hypothetical protein
MPTMATSSVYVCCSVSDGSGGGKRSSFEVRTQHTEARPPSFISTPLKHGEQLRGVEVYVTDSIGALPGQVMAGDVNRNAQGGE